MTAQGGVRPDDPLKDLAKLVDGICRGAERAAAASAVKLGMTFREMGEAWTSGKPHEQWPDHARKRRSTCDDIRRIEEHVYPTLGPLPIEAITMDHIDDVMAELPSSLEPSTRRKVAQFVNREMNLAVYPASPGSEGMGAARRRQEGQERAVPRRGVGRARVRVDPEGRDQLDGNLRSNSRLDAPDVLVRGRKRSARLACLMWLRLRASGRRSPAARRNWSIR